MTTDWEGIRQTAGKLRQNMNHLSSCLLGLCGLQAALLVACFWKGARTVGFFLPIASSLALLLVCQAWYAAESALFTWIRSADRRLPEGTGRALLEMPDKEFEGGRWERTFSHLGFLAGPRTWLDSAVSGFVAPSALLSVSAFAFWATARPAAVIAGIGGALTILELVTVAKNRLLA
jgi:hypothetical protein